MVVSRTWFICDQLKAHSAVSGCLLWISSLFSFLCISCHPQTQNIKHQPISLSHSFVSICRHSREEKTLFCLPWQPQWKKEGRTWTCVNLLACGHVMSMKGIKTYHQTNLSVTPTTVLCSAPHYLPLSLPPSCLSLTTDVFVIREHEGPGAGGNEASLLKDYQRVSAFDFLTSRALCCQVMKQKCLIWSWCCLQGVVCLEIQ